MSDVLWFQDPDGKFSVARDKEKQKESSTNSEPQPPTLYAVILHNDNINGFDYVVGVLQRVFSYSSLKAFWLTLKAHVTGQSNIWQGLQSDAENNAEAMRRCGPDPTKVSRGALPLKVSVIPLS